MRQEPSWQKARLTYETRARQARGRAILKVNVNQANGKANLIEDSDLTKVSSLSEDYFPDPGLYIGRRRIHKGFESDNFNLNPNLF